jgi:hypothetical protein
MYVHTCKYICVRYTSKYLVTGPPDPAVYSSNPHIVCIYKISIVSHPSLNPAGIVSMYIHGRDHLSILIGEMGDLTDLFSNARSLALSLYGNTMPYNEIVPSSASKHSSPTFPSPNPAHPSSDSTAD